MLFLTEATDAVKTLEAFYRIRNAEAEIKPGRLAIDWSGRAGTRRTDGSCQFAVTSIE